MNPSQKLFLIDAYALIFRSYYALIRSPRINSKGQNTSAVFGFVNTLEEILHTEKPHFIGVAFDPKGPTFRHEAYPQYKAQRDATPEDIHASVPIIKSILEAYRIPIYEAAGFEADDVIGTLSEKAAASGEAEVYMFTPDKDYVQLVGPHINLCRPGKGGSGAFEILGVEEIKAKYGFTSPQQMIDLLGLMGDASDNIPGCPGVGEKTAAKLIAQFGSIEQLLARTSEIKGALQRKVIENAEQIRFSRYLATIRRDVPLDFNLEDMRVREPDKQQLKKLFEELEFRTFIRRFLGEEAPVPHPAKSRTSTALPQQGDLFAAVENSAPTNALAEKTDSPTLSSGNAIPEYSSAHANEASLLSVNADSPTETENKENLKSISDICVEYKLVDNEKEQRELCAFLLTSEFVSLDTETTGTDPLRAEGVGLSFSIAENKAFYVPLPKNRDEAQKTIDRFRPVYESPNILKIGQNIKYDILLLMNYGIRVRGPLFDTMIAHYVLRPDGHHGMDYLAEVYLSYRTIHIEELIGQKGRNQRNMADLSPQDVYRYACEDADVTLKLYNIFREKLHALPEAERIFSEIEMPLVSVLATMERNGVRVDTGVLADISRLFTARIATLEEEVCTLAGAPFNLSSPRQVGEVLFDKLQLSKKAKKTKTGQYVTSEEVLQSLSGTHPVVDKILQYRGLKKLVSTYVDALPSLINPTTERIHTSFNQTVTATGRLSSSNPNLQNIPVRGDDGKEIRRAFVPEPGCLFFSADYSQIELRIMAHLSQDQHMTEAFNSGYDIHTATAAKIYHKDISEVTRDERRKAKTANFGIIYGISAFGLARRMNVSRTEASELIKGYFSTYPKVKEYMDNSIALARERGYAETLLGRRSYLPDINSRNAVVRGYAERFAINAPIQGTAADLIKLAMIRIAARMERESLRSKMILQVHDELNFSVLPEEKEQLERLVLEEMQNVYPLSVPLMADSGWGENWLEAH